MWADLIPRHGVNIEFHRNLNIEGRLVGAILYNLSTLFKISFKIAKRLQIHDENAFAADTYKQAVDIAHKLLRQHNLKIPNGDLHHLPIKDIDINDSHEKSLSGSNNYINRLSSWFSLLRLNRSVHGNERQIERFSETLLKYIHSIDWHKDGFEPFDSSVYANQKVRNVFDAISFVKSEVDTLMQERSENEKVLRGSEKRYRQIVELASAGIVEFDLPARRFISVNEYFHRKPTHHKQKPRLRYPLGCRQTESTSEILRHFHPRLGSGSCGFHR